MTGRPRLTVIIPTQGRETLRRALVSIVDETQPSDTEIIVCADTHGISMNEHGAYAGIEEAHSAAAAFGAVYLERDAGHHGYGHPQLAAAYPEARGDWVLVLGDDDEYLPGALGVVQLVCWSYVEEPRPILFRITMEPSASRRVPAAFTIWRDRVLEVGNVSGQSIALPNDPSKLAVYPPHNTGDFDFIRGVVANYGGPERVIWRPEVICVCH